jgi:hypothetical protein
MQPETYYSNYAQPSRFTVGRLVKWLVGILIVTSLVLLFLTYLGYGTVHFDVPNHATVYVNGHRIDEKSVRLRTGSYRMTVFSPINETFQTTQRVNVWSSTFKPHLKQRQPAAIVSSTIGASGLYGKPGISDVRWFGDNTWLVGVVGPGSAAPIALHYLDGNWKVGYYTVAGYPNSLNTLPPEIATYLGALGSKYAD